MKKIKTKFSKIKRKGTISPEFYCSNCEAIVGQLDERCNNCNALLYSNEKQKQEMEEELT